jgi:hypothetical protein
MTQDRKAELAAMCALEIRRTSALTKSKLADWGYHFAQPVLDDEMEAMRDRLSGKPVTDADLPILRELVMDDLWPRLREQHRQHRDFVFDAMMRMNRETISADAEFAFNIGWRQLLQSAADRVETYPKSWRVMIDGGKEKFGCLVLHIDCNNDQQGCRSEVERLREEIRLRSLATCDICGRQGRLRIGGYAKTVCDKHAAIFEGFREDDGRWADPWTWHEEDDIGAQTADKTD